jgi:hypothetical protein
MATLTLKFCNAWASLLLGGNMILCVGFYAVVLKMVPGRRYKLKQADIPRLLEGET